MKKDRHERLKMFFARLQSAEPADSFDAALAQISQTLDQVEDECSGEPNEPHNWISLDRMFPPQSDRISTLPHRPGVWLAKTRGHYVLIGSNGSMEFRRIGEDRHATDGILDLEKSGADGKGLPA